MPFSLRSATVPISSSGQFISRRHQRHSTPHDTGKRLAGSNALVVSRLAVAEENSQKQDRLTKGLHDLLDKENRVEVDSDDKEKKLQKTICEMSTKLV
jgi:hypothetical protein